MSCTLLKITIDTQTFAGRLMEATAPQSCTRLRELLPYRGKMIHARWSGESLWSPLGSAWPKPCTLPEESATEEPQPGEILLYASDKSEPELLIAYGLTRFACRAGVLRGNRVLSLEPQSLARLAELGRQALWHGALQLQIE